MFATGEAMCGSIVRIGARAHHKPSCGLIGRRFEAIPATFAVIAVTYMEITAIGVVTSETIGTIAAKHGGISHGQKPPAVAGG